MLSAIVLLNTERDKTNKVAEALADMNGGSEVYSVAGRYDLAAIVRAQTMLLVSVPVGHWKICQSGIDSPECFL